MRYFVVSDIHGAYENLKEVLGLMNEEDQLLILGDILYHGPRNDIPVSYEPKKVMELLNPYKERIMAVRGNCDGEVDQMVLEFPITADYNQFMLGHRKLFMSHGHIYSPEHLPALKEKDAFLFGHVHLPMAHLENNIYILNPGSLSIPKQKHPASYAILDESKFEIYDLSGNVMKAVIFE